VKNLIFLALIAALFAGIKPANAQTGMREIKALARSQGVDVSNLLTNPPVTCYAPKATRVVDGMKIEYSKAVFILISEVQSKGVLYVSSDTKCRKEYWDLKKYPPTLWQTYEFYNHYPELWNGGLWNSLIRKDGTHDTKPWCRVSRAEVVVKNSGFEIFDNYSYRKLVLFIPSDAWDGLTKEFNPNASWWYVSKDITCFKSLVEAERGGYRFLNK